MISWLVGQIFNCVLFKSCGQLRMELPESFISFHGEKKLNK